MDDAANAHWGTNERLYEIPDEALDPHTATGRKMGRKFPAFWDVSFHLENEDPDLPNEYTQRAINAPAGEFVKGEKPIVWSHETAWEEKQRDLGKDPESGVLKSKGRTPTPA